MSGPAVIFVIIFVLSISGGTAQKKLVCLDDKADAQSSLWTSSSEIKAANQVADLPKSFGDLKGLSENATGLWYFEGPAKGPSKDVNFKGPFNVYSSRAKIVTVYLKYYSNSQRRLSLFPVKGVKLTLLETNTNPSPSQVKWTEIIKEMDVTESPIELTGTLSPREFLILDKLVVAVDTPLPSDLSIPCKIMTSPPTLPPSPTPRSGSGLGSGSGLLSAQSTPTVPPNCPAPPPVPECKCNCLCNCSKPC